MPALREFADRYAALVGRLAQARRADRVAHAYLVAGDDAERLEAFARAWASACACKQPVNGDACGHCETCRQLAANAYPYLNLLRPRSKSRQLRVDDVRELEHDLYLRSGGPLRVGLILHADRMNQEAQNAFLKTLEEPAAGTLLLLVTVNPAALLPTIRSRCQRLNLFDNRTGYDFPEFATLRALLPELRRGRGAAAAMAAANRFLALLEQLKGGGEEHSQAVLAPWQANWDDLEPATRKRLKEEAEAAAAAAYLERRETLLSALHTWFAQELMRAGEVPVAILPNPEFYADEPPPPPPATEARENLRHVEDFIATSHFNVDERLAVHDLCQTLCRVV